MSIFAGFRICKPALGSDVIPGDPYYVKEDDREDLILKCRFFLKNVIRWEEYRKDLTFKNSDHKTWIDLGDGAIIVLISIENFDKIMVDHDSSIRFIKSLAANN